jgi:glycosyltransferase involved in cell wall biosynthesis
VRSVDEPRFFSSDAAREHERALRLAAVTETYPPEVNGVAMTAKRMLDGLARRGHGIQLIRPRQNGTDRPGRLENFEQVLVAGMALPRYPTLKMGLPAKRALLRLWRDRRPDVIHIVTEGPLGWSALRAAAELGIPVSSDFHTNFHSYSRHYGLGVLHPLIAGYLRAFHNRAAMTFVPTRQLLEELAEAGYRNLRVVSRGVDTALFSPKRRCAELRAQWGVNDDQPVVIHVGRFAPEKNIGLALEAFDAIREARPDAKLVLVGDGPQRQATQASHPEHLYAGMRVGEDLAAHYASADLFLFPSLTETFGNVTMEAMASGLAVVAYDYGAAREHARASGLLVRYGDSRAFVQAATRLISDIARMRDIGAQARRVSEGLNWDSVVVAFEAQFRRLLASRGKAYDEAQLIARAD